MIIWIAVLLDDLGSDTSWIHNMTGKSARDVELVTGSPIWRDKYPTCYVIGVHTPHIHSSRDLCPLAGYHELRSPCLHNGTNPGTRRTALTSLPCVSSRHHSRMPLVLITLPLLKGNNGNRDTADTIKCYHSPSVGFHNFMCHNHWTDPSITSNMLSQTSLNQVPMLASTHTTSRIAITKTKSVSILSEHSPG